MDVFGKPKPPQTSALNPERRRQLELFVSLSGARFKNLSILNLALSHRSYVNEAQDSRDNNERLEFLGDSVLGLVVSSYLVQHLPDRPEGELAKIKSFVVSEGILSVLAKAWGLDSLLLIGKGEENSGGRNKKALLADALEAVFGAYYLDAGFEEAEKLVLGLLKPQIALVLEDRHQKDYKTLLQELVQKDFRTYPKYTLTDRVGPDHDRTFYMDVSVEGRVLGSGSGKNKKEAEQVAAGIAYEAITGTSGTKEGPSVR